jgi:hypothetical protein
MTSIRNSRSIQDLNQYASPNQCRLPNVLACESRPWTAEHNLVSIQSHATYDFTFSPMMKAKVTKLLLCCQLQWYLHVNLTVVVIG